MTQAASHTKPWIVMVGGFLGAGKTTLLLSAAKELELRGLRCALILNDQGEALVDSEYASIHGLQRGEVTGGCFCCKFSELVHVMDELRRFSPDIIFAEPVGSCTDISATTLQPLRQYSDNYRLAPFTVLVDPERAKELLRDDAELHLKFLFEKQLQEADLICLTKSDLGGTVPEMPAHRVRMISAKSGQGVAAWLDEVLSGTVSAGSRILDIDYEQYALAEAALVWLNLQVNIRRDDPISAAMLVGPLLDGIDADFTAAGVSIVHLKAIVQSSAGFLKVAFCANGQEPIAEGDLDASPCSTHDLLLNLRALGTSDQVRAIVEQNFLKLHIGLDDLQVSCFHPAPPKPEHRIAAVG
jgi:hypothetical protein